MMVILVWLLMVLLLTMTFCAGILVGWWYVYHVSPEAWAMVKTAACNGIPAGVSEKTKYCPECGAKMDGGDGA